MLVRFRENGGIDPLPPQAIVEWARVASAAFVALAEDGRRTVQAFRRLGEAITEIDRKLREEKRPARGLRKHLRLVKSARRRSGER